MAINVKMTVRHIILASFICYFPVLSEIHTLRQCSSVTSGIKGLPAYIQIDIVDDKVLSHYDSTTQKKAPVQCMKSHLDPQFWNWIIADTKRKQHILTEDLTWVEKYRNQTVGEHVLQLLHYCEWDDETGAEGESHELAEYDGENAILPYVGNRKGLTQELNGSLDDCGSNINPNCVAFCLKSLKNYFTYGKECLKKVPPEVSLFQNSSAVVCHATGFYPKAVNITWKRDGMEIKEDVYVRETLPNGDGTFQKRAVLTVSPEERRKSTYTCEVEHKTGLVIKTLMEGNRLWFWTVIVLAFLIVFGIGISTVAIVLHKRKDQEAPFRCLEFSNRNDRSSVGSAEPMMAGANNVPTYN